MAKQRGAPAAGGAKSAKPTARNPSKPKTVPRAKAHAAAAAAAAAPEAAGPAEAPTKPQASRQQRAIPFNLQQRLLDVFAQALAPALASPHLNEALRAVKRALFERDFAGAFGGVDEGGAAEDASAPDAVPDAIPPLDAYAARWSPTRALCYASILGSPLVQEHWHAASASAAIPPLRMVAIGGGAAEIVAFAALLTAGEAGDGLPGDLVLIDAGPWAGVVGRLRDSLTHEDPSGRKPAVLVEPAERLSVDVRQVDILTVEDGEMGKIIGGAGGAGGAAASQGTTTLVTLFFTLNELFTAGGLGAAATFLLRLTNASPPGTVLLVVDSPGSYAETAVGAQARRYPMRWLLDKFLLNAAGGSGAWSKAHEDDAVWFRLPASLSYPIRLEDMRYQMHLYVRM